jgi:hypothetical protein
MQTQPSMPKRGKTSRETTQDGGLLDRMRPDRKKRQSRDNRAMRHKMQRYRRNERARTRQPVPRHRPRHAGRAHIRSRERWRLPPPGRVVGSASGSRCVDRSRHGGDGSARPSAGSSSPTRPSSAGLPTRSPRRPHVAAFSGQLAPWLSRLGGRDVGKRRREGAGRELSFARSPNYA